MILQILFTNRWKQSLFPLMLLFGWSVMTAPPSAQSNTANRPLLPAADWPVIEAILVKSGFDAPIHVTHAGDGSGRLFVVEQAGIIKIVKAGDVLPTPFLDIHERVNSSCSECGLLSVAFPPDYASKGYFFVYYNAKGNPAPGPGGDEPDPAQGNDSVIARFRVTANPDQANAQGEEQILLVNQPYSNHNGGQLAFGKDGYLYAGFGDGGSGGDPLNSGQRLDTLLGKILRIEVGASGTYTVPADNPFRTNTAAKSEIWSYGWRNPWRFSFDRITGDLYVGDVGQNRYEEVDFELVGTGGLNYGWKRLEGTACYNATSCDRTGTVLPIFDYPRDLGYSVTGGVVYRGPAYPRLQGIYFFGDYGSGRMWGARRNVTTGRWEVQELLDTPYNISSFGEDEAGELYFLDYNGALYQLKDAGGTSATMTPTITATITPNITPTAISTSSPTPTPQLHYLPFVNR